jgi:hypothetical protein
MNGKAKWQPTDFDIAWTRALITGSDGDLSLWGVKANRAVYLIDRTVQRFTLVHGPKDKFKGCDLFAMLSIILPKIGWTVEEATPGNGLTEKQAADFWKQMDSAPDGQYVVLKDPSQQKITAEMRDDMLGKGKTRQPKS